MSKRTNNIGLVLAGGLLLAAVALTVAFGFTSNASAKAATAAGLPIGSTLPHFGPGFPGGYLDEDEYLADALGVTVEELQAARQEAADAAIQAALDQGLITQEQADALTLRGFFGGRGFRGGWFGFPGRAGKFSDAVDYDALLAEALGISVEELQSAREEAQSAMLTQAVEDGLLTQDQADLILARRALQSYLEPEALFAEALGITVEQLQGYRDDGLSLSEILAESGMTAVEAREALEAAREAAIQQAVEDGAITQDQADQILDDSFLGGGFGGFGHRGGFRRGGFWAPVEPTTPESEGTSL